MTKAEIMACSSLAYINPKLVPVIASFNSHGDVKPLYIELDGEPRKIISYKETTRFRDSREYDCDVKIGEKTETIKLGYYIFDNVWGLPLVHEK